MARFERDGEAFEITSEAGHYATQQRDRLRAGWRRVRDPRVEVSVEGEPREPVLEAQLTADPDDAAAAVVYADWLQQRGHPRGTLIAVQHGLALRPADADLLAEERRVLRDAGDALLSRPLQRRVESRGAHGQPIELVAERVYQAGVVHWRHGFIRGAVLPIDAGGGDEDLLWEVLRHPSCRFLAELAIQVAPPRDVGLVAALLLHTARPPLRRLAIDVAHQRYRPPTLELAGLAEAFPMLEELALAVDHVHVGSLALPRLRRLTVATRGEHDDVLDALAQVAHPGLAELAIARANPVHLAPVFDRGRVPGLRVLRLPAAPRRGRPHVEIVAGSSVAAQLEELDLATTALGSESLELLVARRDRFPRLARLRVDAPFVEHLRHHGYPAEPA